MKKVFLMVLLCALTFSLYAQNLPVKMEEMTAPQYVNAVDQSNATCIIPIGVLEKHGPHLPLGTDLIDVREVVLRAAAKEYAIVFPPYYFSQIFEARHQPGTIAYSQKLIWNMLQETCDELGRNGIKKIVLVSGHGGNSSFLPFFCQSQLASKKDYAVVLFQPSRNAEAYKEINKELVPGGSGHAGQSETSVMLAHRPDLVHMDKATSQSGKDQDRIKGIDSDYEGIWWYAKYPNHYCGDGSLATKELGEKILNAQVDELVTMLKQVKADNTILEMQNKFYEQAKHPMDTKQ
ncbi:creatininase family protein [Prolixibacter denitrificans]|uniref:Creatinine amidohydrolase n=1 Tax=Prolixibacter denitrificans TaxID=1541063 RepID=A0A2P8C9J6_9BACT|nr:creatininase family protein [Prolixibacter denitrificans]PSK81633.1 creatinine amidohydrolase [Prolixibacter denitrificans]GET21159.1 creatinine amidohydrolase [Prolixibacter denitrificans]